MKKFLGAICSAVTGVLAFIFLALDWCTVKMSAMGMSEKESYSGWDLIKDKYDVSELDGYTMYKIFAIIMLVVAILLIVAAVIMLLKNLNIIKINFNVSSINNILLAVFVLSVILAMVGLLIMGADIKDELGKFAKVEYWAGIGAWLTLVVGAVSCGLGWSIARKD